MMNDLEAATRCLRCGAALQSRRARGSGLCSACREGLEQDKHQQQAGAAIADLLEREDVLILDTETTGLSGAEIIEVSVINTQGRVLLDTLVQPRRQEMNPYAERLHGISLAMLSGAPRWPQVLPQLCDLAEGRTILAWNAPFDAGMVRQTSGVWGYEQPSWRFVCAMRLYARRRGLRARGLHKAVQDENLAYLLERYRSHRALADTRFALEVLRASLRAEASGQPA